jgi:hypothetical protein
VGICICPVLAPTPPPGLTPGGISIYEAESQSANFAYVQGLYASAGAGAGIYPFVISGLHHTDIFGYGKYSVTWARGNNGVANCYASLNIVGGFLGHGFVQNSDLSNVTLEGAQFVSGPGFGAVSGSYTNLINGWWTVDMVQYTQFAGPVQWRQRQLLSTDANHTINTTTDTWVLLNAPAMPRVITLSNNVYYPAVGQRIRVTIPALAHVNGNEYQFIRTGSGGPPNSVLANVWSSAVIPNMHVFLDFEYAEGLVLGVVSTANSSGAYQLTLSKPAGALGNPTDTLASGDQVTVSGVGSGVNAPKGPWTINVVNGTQIILNGSTYAAGYGGGGTVQITPGVWRLAASSGTSWDGTRPVGVVPDIGA